MNKQNNMDSAIKEILKSLNYLIKSSLKKTTQVYEGVVISAEDNGKWNVQYNGEIHGIKAYGNITPSIGKIVKVIVPQGNQAIAFFI